MIDPAHLIVSMQPIPAGSFIGLNDGARLHRCPDERDGCGLGRRYGWDGPAARLTRHNHRLPLVSLLLGQPAILAVGLFVRGLGVATDLHPVDFDLAGQLGANHIGANGFPQLVRQDEYRLVLNVQIATKL